ncbi:hypothetical protein AArcMg_4133 (plasmid) [Natrarchaeobaculum sulfurireducens]|uniref:IS6 family transposase n=1 Tax=Natrarchaeobaculum sulfurireducens TaxID=2044521 RepID=A0A346P9S6_9EURY|nr:IS6 family transposase [Natrarchaeobaculum sulfurireducens]AXR79958.1 hypothetical protein AArcMg_4133 [Natrarchaeobaculum sulfurireducens]
MIRLDDEQYWLYAAVDPDPNELHHTKLEPTRIKVIVSNLFESFERNATSTTPCFSSVVIDRYRPL